MGVLRMALACSVALWAGDVGDLFRAAQRAQARQDLAAAATLYEHVVKLDPALAEAHSNLGLVYYLQGRYDDALRTFHRALKQQPGLFVPVLFSGMAHAKMGRYSAALPLLQQALKQRPADPQALMYLGLSHSAAGRPERAAPYFERLAAGAPKDPEALYQLGKAYLSLSVDSFAKVQELEPEGFLHNRILARIDEARKKPPAEIERRWREIVAARPDYPGMHRQLASALERAGKANEAAEALRKETEISGRAPAVPRSPAALLPGNDAALERWTRDAIGAGRVAAARDALRALARKHPKWAMPRFLLGEVYFRLSLDAHQRLYAVEPAGYRAVLLDGEAREAADEYEEAEKAYRAAAATEPRAPGVHYRLGLLLVKQHQPEQAVEEFAREVDIDPYHVPARLRLGETLLFLERNDEAIAALERVVKDDPAFQLGHVVLGRAYLGADRLDEAARALERAVALDRADRQAHHLLARVYQRQGRREEARRELEIFRSLQ